ncbi:MAG: hypothetical protein HYS08_02995 [Chlamydiae bacterium]|nr:hypothetical protein [Chlamydiota bacterium]
MNSNVNSVGLREDLLLYPLQGKFLLLGIIASVTLWLAFLSFPTALALFTVFAVTGILWRRDEAPVLAFCIAFQWVSATAAYFYEKITGYFPDLLVLGDTERTLILSLIGFMVLTVGIRGGVDLLAFRFKREASVSHYDIKGLFYGVIVLYSASWLVEVNPKLINFEISEVIARLFDFRTVILFLLFLSVLQQRRGYLYAMIAGAWVLIPSVGSYHAAFTQVLFLFFIALLSVWHPWARIASQRLRSRKIALTLLGASMLIFFMGLLWIGSMQHAWRAAILSRSMESPVEKVNEFKSVLESQVPGSDFQKSLESFTRRLSSGFTYFSLVLDRVPSYLPHEGGKLVRRAVDHCLRPRFLFPEKPFLGSNSWLVRLYAGIPVAGEESGTSVGLPYMAEFYIDFGVMGMMIALLVYGFVLGLIYQGLVLVSPSTQFASAVVTVIFIQQFLTFDGEIAYTLGGFLNSLVVFGAILLIMGRWLHRRLVLS